MEQIQYKATKVKVNEMSNRNVRLLIYKKKIRVFFWWIETFLFGIGLKNLRYIYAIYKNHNYKYYQKKNLTIIPFIYYVKILYDLFMLVAYVPN